MVQRSNIINVLRRLGYKYKDQTKRMTLYKKEGSTQRVLIPRSSLVMPEQARSILRQAGMPDEEVERFISNNSRPDS